LNVLINASRSIKSEVPINRDIADLNRGAILWVSITMRDERRQARWERGWKVGRGRIERSKEG
jgi:hypothetical protein